MKRIICLVIVLLMIMPALLSCSDVNEALPTLSPKSTSTPSDDTPDGPSVLGPQSDVYDENLINEYYGKYTEKQRIYLAMLNYYTVNTQKLMTQKNNRLFLESLYSELYNKVIPDTVDNTTKSKITTMLNNLEKLRMISVKRDRIQFLYEKAQAQAIRDAIPNPSQMLNVVLSGNWVKAAASAALMAIDSVSNYKSSLDDADRQLLNETWELDNAQSAAINDSVVNVFNYMVSQANDYDLDGLETLSIEYIKSFAENLNDSNVNRRMDFLKKNKNTYKYYGGYWLALSDCYYEKGDYRRCLDAVLMYEKICPRILRKDHSYATALVKVVDILCRKNKDLYVLYAPEYCRIILENISEDDWAIRYFVAITYLDFNDMKNAFYELQTNVRVLSIEQQKLNSEFLSINDEQKTELPQISEPLYTNLEMIDAVADALGMGSWERKKEVLNLIVDDEGIIFLNAPLDIYFHNMFGGESPLNNYISAPLCLCPPRFTTRSDSDAELVKSGLGKWILSVLNIDVGSKDVSSLYELDRDLWERGEIATVAVAYNDGKFGLHTYMITKESNIKLYIDGKYIDDLKMDSVSGREQYYKFDPSYYITFLSANYSSKKAEKIKYTDGMKVTLVIEPYPNHNNGLTYTYNYRIEKGESNTFVFLLTE